MLVKLSSLVLLLACSGAAFRVPDNVQRNVELPNIRYPNAKQVAYQESIRKTNNAKVNVELQDIRYPNAKQIAYQESMRKSNLAKVEQRLGIDNSQAKEYWHDSRIHSLGNIGIGGAVHAALAPMSTKLIDVLAYNGTDIRQLVSEELSQKIKSSNARVLDLCCGVGISTRALRSAFPGAQTVIGVDTSSQMISMAQFLTQHLSVVKPLMQSDAGRGLSMVCAPATATFARGNAERTSFSEKSFDLVTIMYALHEAPATGREQILREAHRLLEPGGTLAVIDIAAEYTPSPSMLAGEPYVLEYQKNINRQIRTLSGFAKVTYKTIVPNVGMWVLQRSLY